jgi:AhpD family alkylhydroperoxidase
VLGTFAHHPELAKAFFTYNGHLLWATSLTPRQREIIVLRISVLLRCRYLWAQHVFEARDGGLTEEEISRIAFGPDAPFFAPLDEAIIRAVDELHEGGAISEPTMAVLEEELDERQVLDLLFTVGCYTTTSWLFNTIELDTDPGIPEMYQRYQRPPEHET